ncbi:non-hydrolyzing UDP-N-acetylglucosamine 2-epimerase [Mesotoga sp.]|uniref:non-hydrolyzing UDP-N-acetylglucosamine 2-epimerase n=1 Tax=Mesotoga sp. TaxID=2053577 RepID=UPI00345F12E9
MKIATIVGARPQFIKEAVVGEELRKAGFEHVLIHTGQHYDYNMSEVFFNSLEIKEPDYNLGVGSGSHAVQTGLTMMRLEEVVIKEEPDVVLVYGDTNATVAGALVSAKLKIRVAHVEAGMRQEPRDMPEEINRVLTDRISSILFCPSQTAVKNLKKEGMEKGVWFTGDVMYDLFLKMEKNFDYSVAEQLDLEEDGYVVVTIHRDFNTDNRDRLEKILRQLNIIVKDKRIVFPIHPRTRRRIKEFGLENHLENLDIIDPLDYLSMMGLVKHSWKLITDSGGLQKESYFAGKQAVVVMPDTGWIELVDAGINLLASPSEISTLLFYDSPLVIETGLYGEGNASKICARAIAEDFEGN